MGVSVRGRPTTLADLYQWAEEDSRTVRGAQFGGFRAGGQRIVQFVFQGVNRLGPIFNSISSQTATVTQQVGAAGNLLGSAFSNAARQVASLNPVLAGVGRQLQNFSGRFVDVNGRLNQVGFSVLFLGLNLQNLGRAAVNVGERVIRGVTGIFSVFTQFDTAARRAFTQVSASGATALRLFQERILGIATRVPQTFQQIADAAFEVFSTIPAAARQPDEAFKIVEASARAAQAGFIDLGEAARFASQIMNAFGKTNVVEVFDAMFKLLREAPGTFAELVKAIQAVTPAASATRQTFEDTAAVLGVLARNIGNVSIAGTQVRNIFQALSRRDVQSALKTIGVDVFDDTGKFRSFVDVIEDLGSKMRGLSDQARTRVLQDIFGGRTGNVPLRQLGIDILLRNYDQLRGLQRDVINNQGELDREFQKTLGPQAAMEIGFNNLKAAAFEFGASAAGTIVHFADLLVLVARVLGNLPDPLKRFLVIFGTGFGVVAIVLGTVALLLGQVLTSIIALAQLSNLGLISAAFGNLGAQVLRATGALGLLGVAIFFIVQFHSQLATAISRVWDTWPGKIIIVIASILLFISALRLIGTILAPLGTLLDILFIGRVVRGAQIAGLAVGRFIIETLGLAVAQIVTAVSASLGAVVLEAVAAASASQAAMLAIGLAAIAVIALIIAAVTGGLDNIARFVSGVFRGIVNFASNIGTYISRAVGALRGLTRDPFAQSRQSADELNRAIKGTGDTTKFASGAQKDLNNNLSDFTDLEKANKRAQEEAYKAALQRYRGDRDALHQAQINVRRDAADVQVALQAQQDKLQDLQGELSKLQNKWNEAKAAMEGYVNVLLPGERSARDAIFQQEQRVKALQLALLKAGEAGSTGFASVEDALKAFQDTLRAFNLDKILDRDLIDQLRQSFIGAVGEGSGGLANQLDLAQKKLQQLQLQTELTFDPLHHQLEEAADLTKTMTFKEALNGILRSRREMDALKPSIDKASLAVQRQQAIVDGLEARYRKLKDTARGLGLDLSQQALSRPVSPGSLPTPTTLPPLSDLLEQGDTTYKGLQNLQSNLSNLDLLGGFATKLDSGLGRVQRGLEGFQRKLDEFTDGVKGRLDTNSSNWQTFGFVLGALWAGINNDFAGFLERHGVQLNGWIRVLSVLLGAPERLWKEFWSILDSLLLSGNREIFKGLGQLLLGMLKIFSQILRGLVGFRTDWRTIWRGIADIASGIWHIIVGVITKGINLVIDVINGFLALIRATGYLKGAGAGVGDLLGRGLHFALAHLPGFPRLGNLGDPYALLARVEERKVYEAIKSKTVEFIKGSFVPALGAVGAALLGALPTGSNAAIVTAVAATFGWIGAQLKALFSLLMGESGLRNTAQNPTSTAFGMYQFLDSTWASVGGSKTSDPRLQSIYGDRYIKLVYGDPEHAYAAWLSRSPHWYHAGTISVPDDMLAWLQRGETVVPASTSFSEEIKAAVREGRGGTDGSKTTTINYNIREIVLPNVEDGKDFQNWMMKLAGKSEAVT